MINLNKYNNLYSHGVEAFFKKTNVFNINDNNLNKINQLYTEVYGDIFSDDEITNILQENINEIHYFNEFRFFDKETSQEVYFFDVLIEKKEIKIENNVIGYIYTYMDDITLGNKLNQLNIFHGFNGGFNGEKIHLNEKIELIGYIAKFMQKNIFTHLFRSLFVDIYGNIINVFHLRFFNQHEYYNLAKENIIWEKLLKNSKNFEDIIMEKVDGQLLMIYKYNDNVYFQSKNALITLDVLNSGNYDKNGIFGSLVKLFNKNNDKFFNNLINIFNNLKEGIVYHFEFLCNNNPIVQEYKNPGLYLLGGRYINNFQYVIDLKSGYNIFELGYNKLYNDMYYLLSGNENNDISNLIFDIIIGNDLYKVEDKIRKYRNPDNTINNKDYIIEGIILTKGYMFIKIKNYQYFIKKLMKSFSYKKSFEILKGISSMLNKDANHLTIYTNELLSGNIKDQLFLNNTLDNIKSLKLNRPLKISYIKFLNYLDKYKSEDEINIIINSFKSNKKLVMDTYKDFLVMSFIDIISGMLTSDREEISSLGDILQLTESELDFLLKSYNLKEEVKKIIIRTINIESKNTYFISNLKTIINDIYSIDV